MSSGNVGEWMYIVFERYNGYTYAWINGVSQAVGGVPTGGTPSYAGLGYSFGTEYGGHYVDEVRFTYAARYKGAISIPIQTVSWPENAS